MSTREDFGRGEFIMLSPIHGIRSPYDTSTKQDVDLSRCAGGIMGNFCKEGHNALFAVKKDVEAEGGVFLISDMFRDWMMQWQANQDYVLKKKAAYSPPPGKSFHNAGRSFDVALKELLESIEYKKFWQICRDHGFVGVRKNRHEPDEKATEAWHMDYLGSFEPLYQRQGYALAAQVASMDAIGDNYPDARQEQIKNFRIQAYLLKLGLYDSTVDGIYGEKQHRAYMTYISHANGIKDIYLDTVLRHYGMIA